METVIKPKASLDLGLPAALYAAVVAFSVALFLTWGGLLWSAPREASHVGRFAVSYLAVIPAAAALLAALRRFSWTRLITATAAAWALKLIITSVLYIALARGTAVELHASETTPPRRSAAKDSHSEYQAAAPGFAAGGVRGVVTRGGAPVAGAIVFIDAPRPGRAPGEPQAAELVIERSRYAAPIYLATTVGGATVSNRDGSLHTVHLYRDGKGVANDPLPASPAPHALRIPDEGVYRIRCDNHPDEATTLVVVDHPYATRTDAAGAYSLAAVPAGPITLVAVAPRMPAGQRAARALSQVTPGQEAERSFDLLDLENEDPPE